VGLVAYFEQEMPVFQHRKHLVMLDRDKVKTQSRDIRHVMETQDRSKTGHTSVEIQPSPRHEKPWLETVL